MSEFGFEPGMHSYADQAGFYPSEHPREHNATEVGRIVARYIADTASFTRGNAKVRAEMAATNRSAQRGRTTWANYGKYGVLAVGAMVLGSAKSFAMFDRNMNIFAANLDEHGPKAARHMKAAREEAKRLGADSRFPAVTASHVAESFVELSKAGMNYKRSMAAIEDTMLLGTAGQLDFADAASITSNAMNAFGMTTKKEVHGVVDAIAGAALKSSSDVGDIAEAFRYASTAAHTLGVPMKQVTSLTGMLSNLGLKGDMAGTSMRMFFTSIAKPRSGPALEAMKKQGLITKGGKSLFFDKNGEIKALDEIADIYKKHTANLNKKQRLAFNQTVFGVRGQNVAAVLNQGGAAFRKFQKESTKQGSANRLAEANTKGLYGAYQALVNVIQTIGLELGEQLAPTLIDIAHKLTVAAQVIQEHKGIVRAFAKGIVYATLALVALKGVLILYKIAAMAARAITLLLKGAWYALRGAAYAVRGAIIATRFVVNAFRNTMILTRIATMLWRGALLAARGAMILLNMAFLTSPIGWIVLGIVGLVLVLRKLGVGMDDVKRVFTKGWAAIKGAFSGAWHWVKSFFTKHWKQALVIALMGPFGALLVLIQAKWDTIKSFFMKPIGWLKETFKKHWKTALLIGLLGPIGAIIALVRTKWDDIKRILRRVITWIKDLGVDAYNAAKALGGQIKDGVLEGMKGLGKAIHDATVGRIPGVKQAEGLVGRGKDLLRANGGPVTGGMPYIVGERGPEWFVPRGSGHIVPNGGGGGGGPSVIVEHMSVRSEEDPYVIASVLSRRAQFAQ